MLEVYNRLGQIIAASGWSVQWHATFNNGDKSFNDVNMQRRSNAPEVLLSGI